MSDQTKPPAWAVEAVREIETHFQGQRLRPDLPGIFAAIIAKHAPRPKQIKWQERLNGFWFAHTPVGDYAVSGMGWHRVETWFGGPSENLDQAKAAAQADFAERVAKCMEAGDGNH